MQSYSVLDFGAKTNGQLTTKEIQSAIDACFINGGGEVIIPKGKYVIGSIRIRSNVTLHLLEDAELIGSTNPEDYLSFLDDKVEPLTEDLFNPVESSISTGRGVIPTSRWNNAMVKAFHAENIKIIGEKGSVFDGQNCFDEVGEEGYRGPHTFNFWFCNNVELIGYTIKDSGNWAHAIQNSQNIKVNNITILAGHDGFDIRTCDNVTIENSEFYTGDDCIAGFDNINVHVNNCIFDSACSFLRFGGADVVIENCKGFAPSRYGHRYGLSNEKRRERAATDENCRHNCHNSFLYYCDNRAKIRKTPGNILIKNCHFKNPDAIINLPFGHVWCCNRSLHDLTYENCVFDGLNLPSVLSCPENEPLTLTLTDCTAIAREGFDNFNLFEAINCESINLNNFTSKGFSNPTILCKTDVKININGGTKITVIKE